MPEPEQSIENMEAEKNLGGLIDALESQDPLRVAGAVKALGRLGDPRAVGPLIALLYSNEDYGTRIAAINALVALSGMLTKGGAPGDMRALVMITTSAEELFEKMRKDAGGKGLDEHAKQQQKEILDNFAHIVRVAALRKFNMGKGR
jgi:hypothetical protein